MIEIPSLFDDQLEVRDKARAALAKRGGAIICAEPGFGKTRLAKHILATAASRPPGPNQSGRYIFAVHRRGLVDNASEDFRLDPVLPHGMIMAGEPTDWSKRVSVASIDTALSWFTTGGHTSSTTFDLLVYDESHAHLQKFKRFLEGNNKRRAELGLAPGFAIGLSATPDAKGQSDIFGEIVTGPSPGDLIAAGRLSPFRYKHATQVRTEALKRRGGEFTQASQDAATRGLYGDFVRDWLTHSRGRPTVGFFSRLAAAKEAQELLTAAGVRAAYVDAQTSDERRRQLFRQLGDGTIEYLCNVGIVERGTNIPAISCIQLCLAIGRLSRLRQFIGRGSRLFPGKVDCLILDHGMNLVRHSPFGFFENQPVWVLDVSTDPPGEPAERVNVICPECQEVYHGGRCPACGWEPPAPDAAQQPLQFASGEMVDVTPTTKPAPLPSPERHWISCLYRAARSGMTYRQAVGMAFRDAKKRGMVFRIPKEFTIAGTTFSSLQYNDPQAARRVRAIWPELR